MSDTGRCHVRHREVSCQTQGGVKSDTGRCHVRHREVSSQTQGGVMSDTGRCHVRQGGVKSDKTSTKSSFIPTHIILYIKKTKT